VEVWNWQQGWGFIKFEGDLPKKVMTKVKDMQKAAQEKGKEAKELLLYLRTSDVRKGQRIQKESAVLFQVYTDDKGAGATDVHCTDSA